MGTGSSPWRAVAIIVVIVSLGIMLWFSGCNFDSAPEDLKQAASVIRWELRPKNLEKSMFLAAHPNEREPSDWIDFRGSSLGASERGYSEEDAESDPRIREQARAIRMPLWPRGVTVSPWEVNPEGGRQIVLRSDNANDQVIVEGYTDPKKPPVLKRAFKLPRVSAGAGVKEMYDSRKAEEDVQGR